MCIVSRLNNYIFFHIPKCGGTSISEILPNKEKVKLIQHTHLDYISTKFAFEKNNELNFFNNSKKFAIVRNPFDRVISLYCYIKQHTDHHLHNRLINHDFIQFCYFLRNVGDDSITSCYQHLCDDNGFIDDSMKIYKLEEINNSDFFYKTTIESDLLIKDIFIKDLNIFYKELL